MADEDAIKLRSKELLTSLVQDSTSRLPEPRRAEARQYYERKAGFFRALASRVIRIHGEGLAKDAAVTWAVENLRQDALAKTVDPTQKAEFGLWFRNQGTMLRGVAGRFYRFLSEPRSPVLGESSPADTRRSLGISDALVAFYLSSNAAREADVAGRTEQNLAAIEVLASGRALTESDRQVLAGYTGWGGLSIERVESRIPSGWRPEPSALIHEYYTPPDLCLELARVLRPFLPNGPLRALEPSAGIGRFVNALSLAGFEGVSWTAVEYSSVSAAILRALRPDVRVVESSFERFVAAEEQALAGTLDLVVSNPPYGERGATANEDPHPDYRERRAYVYFLRRGLDLLKAGGIGVFLIPYGLLTGTSPEFVNHRRRLLRRHHLMAAFRLPSGLFPGANLVTDLLLFRSRGGELPEVDTQDLPLLEGRYFELFPSHLLGKEVRGEKGRADE